MKVPFADLGLQHEEIKKEMNLAMAGVIKRGDFILGRDVEVFENDFAEFCGVKYAVGVSSGTAALFLSVLSLGIGLGDEVIIPDFTYIATALAVSYTGAKPVFVDIEEDTYNIDVTKIRQAITKHTRAIMPVHLYGQSANMPEIIKIAKEYNLKIIEDAAQAHGAAYISPQSTVRSPQKAGAMGDIGCFSFYPTKNLGALGDGGMIVTNKENIYKKLLMLRDYGRVSKYEHAMIGYNSRLDTLQAAILRIKLKKLNVWNKMRKTAAGFYNECFSDERAVITPYVSAFAEHIYHVYSIRVKKRDALFQELKKKGVGVLIHYPIPVHLQEAYKGLGYKKGDFPVSERIALEIMSLPMYPHIKESQIRYVANTIKIFLSKS